MYSIFLERNLAAAADTFISRYHESGFTISNPGTQCFRRKPAEDNRMDSADAGTGQHGNTRFNNHGHVDSDNIALLDALIFQNVRELTGFFVQFAVGHVAGIGRVVALENDGRLITALFQVTVQAVSGGVQLAVFKPFDG